LANLLPRFYEPQSGRVLLDGVNIRDYGLAALREQITYVSQDVVLFNDTIANNIAYGRQGGAERDQIVTAAEAAHAMEFISRLPDGLDTLIGENGVLLSAGQRQRLAIARALLKDAPVLLLDEATSSLDSEAERHIQAALEALVKNRTTLVIAHRLSTVENAHRIVVLHEGRIVETGTHAQLLAKNGAYTTLYRLQFRHSAQPNQLSSWQA
jgi:subfamily B ATP-binding cassette protein MsbA